MQFSLLIQDLNSYNVCSFMHVVAYLDARKLTELSTLDCITNYNTTLL